jgi:HEAT repeat protein
MLHSIVASDRSAALHAFGNIGHPPADVDVLQPFHNEIIEAIDDNDEDVRWSAIYCLSTANVEPCRSVPLLIRAVQDPSERVAANALWALSKLPNTEDLSAAVPILSSALGRGREVADRACTVLSQIGPKAKSAACALATLLGRDDPRLVLKAIGALWAVDARTEEALPILGKWLGSGDSGLCEMACHALVTIGPRAASLKSGVSAALNVALSSGDDDLQLAACDAIGAIIEDDGQATSVLIDALKSHSGLVRSSALRALQKIGERTVPLLTEALEDSDEDTQEWIIDVLGGIGPKAHAALPQLRRLMNDGSPNVGAWSAIAIGKIAAEQSTIPVLTEVLRRFDGSNIRRQAAEALARVGQPVPRVISALRAALKDHDEDVRIAAQRALDAIAR